MEEVTSKLKELINLQVLHNQVILLQSSQYEKIYYFTNENINYYMNKISFKGKSNALTVLSSGDHVFNLIHNGIKNIDTFDINNLAEYYALGLKLAIILKNNYQDFETTMKKIKSFDISLNELTQILYDLLPYIDNKYRNFWKEIIDYNYKIQKDNNTSINLIEMISYSNADYIDYKFNNNYLLTEENYNKFKSNLLKSNITFKNCNIINLNDKFKNKYDFIFLSNILDYLYLEFGIGWRYDKLNKLYNDLNNLLNENGILALAYISYFKTKTDIQSIFDYSLVHLEDIKNEEIIEVPNFINNKDIYSEDALILRKKFKNI